jgi:hypothetical protein
LEKGEITIVAIQFVALIAVVLVLSSFTEGNSTQSTPVFNTVYWGVPGQNIPLHMAATTTVRQNETVITAYFSVAFSTHVSSITATRLCIGANASAGESTTYTNIPWGYDSQVKSNFLTITPTGQPTGWQCTYTIKVTDGLSQTTSWLGTVELTS